MSREYRVIPSAVPVVWNPGGLVFDVWSWVVNFLPTEAMWQFLHTCHFFKKIIDEKNLSSAVHLMSIFLNAGWKNNRLQLFYHPSARVIRPCCCQMKRVDPYLLPQLNGVESVFDLLDKFQKRDENCANILINLTQFRENMLEKHSYYCDIFSSFSSVSFNLFVAFFTAFILTFMLFPEVIGRLCFTNATSIHPKGTFCTVYRAILTFLTPQCFVIVLLLRCCTSLSFSKMITVTEEVSGTAGKRFKVPASLFFKAIEFFKEREDHVNSSPLEITHFQDFQNVSLVAGLASTI